MEFEKAPKTGLLPEDLKKLRAIFELKTPAPDATAKPAQDSTPQKKDEGGDKSKIAEPPVNQSELTTQNTGNNKLPDDTLTDKQGKEALGTDGEKKPVASDPNAPVVKTD